MPTRNSDRFIVGFCKDRSGAAAMLFGLMMIPLVMIAGGAIEFWRVSQTRTKLQGILDSAVLAGSTAAARALKAGASVEAAKTAGANAAKTAFNASSGTLGSATVASFSVEPVTVDAVTANYRVTASVSVPTNLLRLAGLTQVPLNQSATASTAAGNQYIDVYLMVDTSGSMMLGATQTDIDALNAKFGCAFACHDGAATTPAGDSYQWSVANGITLRYTALFQGVTALANYINAVDPGHRKIRLAVYSFDTTLNLVHPLSNSFNALVSKYPEPAVDDSEAAGATMFNENVATVLDAIGNGGDGSSAASSSKLLIIATDGVQDPGRRWTWDLPLREQVRGFDMSFCDTAKSRGVAVGIINTPYLPMPWDWGYVATLGQPSTPGPTRVDEIVPAMQSCAGPLFVSAKNTADIRSSFTTIMQSFNTTRLTQ